jgi:hypothetical protein
MGISKTINFETSRKVIRERRNVVPPQRGHLAWSGG